MIEVQNLAKQFGLISALEDISFSAKEGEILGFLGPNGAGKTTTMRILTGFLAPSAGFAQISGYDVFTESLKVRRQIGYLPENVPLYGFMKVSSYLRFMGHIKGLSGKRLSGRVQEVVQVCHLEDVLNRVIDKISKGYRQRVGLAQAIIHEPRVLILDEPTLGLDPQQIIETRKLIRKLGKDRTVILSSHILPEVSMVCDRVVIINEGKIVETDTPEGLSRKLKGSETVQISVREPLDDLETKLAKLPGVERVGSNPNVSETNQVRHLIIESALGKDLRPEIAALVVNSGHQLLEMQAVGMSLEDVFLKLTTKEEIQETTDA